MPVASSALKQRSNIGRSAFGTAAPSSNGLSTVNHMPRPANLVRAMKENRATPFIASTKEKSVLSQQQQQQQQQRMASLIARINELELENSNLRKCLDNANNCRSLLVEVHEQAVLSMQHLSKFAQLSKSALDGLVLDAPPPSIAPVPPVTLAESGHSTQPVAAKQLETHVAATLTTVEININDAQPNRTAAKLPRRTITLDSAPSQPVEVNIIQHQLARHLTPLIESPDASTQSRSEPELMELHEGQEEKQEKQCQQNETIEPMEVQHEHSPKSGSPQSKASENSEPVEPIQQEKVVAQHKQQKAKPKSRQLINLKRPIQLNRKSKDFSSQKGIVEPVEEQQGAPLQNPFIPRHRLARTPPQPGAAQNVSMNSSNNVTLEHQTLSSPLSRQTLSPTKTVSPSTPLLTKELSTTIQRRTVGNCVGGKSHQRRGTFVVKQQQSLPSSATNALEKSTTPPVSPAVTLCHATLVSPPQPPIFVTLIELQQQQSGCVELPSWPTTDRAGVSNVENYAELISTVVKPDVRLAPRPSMLPKRLSPASATKPAGSVARRSSLALTNGSNQTWLLSSNDNVSSDSANTADDPMGPAPSKRHRRMKKQSAKQGSSEENFVASEAIEEPTTILRPRRQRNAAVNYKEPSVNAKMRREDK